MYLGIDLGTSGVKVILADAAQEVVAVASGGLTFERPHSGWAEQDPASWIAATRSAIANIREDHADALKAVRGIGLSGQMHGATLLDASDEVIRPCILWNDTRSHAEAAKLDADPRFRETTGNVVFPGFTAPKLDWVKANEPAHFDATKRVLLPKDYLRLWLTGEAISEMSDASGTSWLDVGNRCWSDDLLAATGLDRSHMPELVEGSAPGGQLRAAVADELGLPAGIVVAGGAGDNAASAVAMGTVQAGSGFLSIGTSGVIFAANDAFLPKPESAVHAFCHALPETWHQMGVILSAAASIDWYAGIVGASARELTDALGAELRAPTGAMFLPYLSGERTPHNDAAVRGSFHGLGGEMDRASLTQAVLEGVAFAFRDNLEALRSTGTTLDALTVVGGGMRSDYWLQVIATALDIEIHVPDHADYGGALGALRLAILADGAGSVAETCSAPPVKRVVSPNADHCQAFETQYGNWQALYSRAD